MNNLSWMLYWASVAPQMSTWICVLSAILFLASLAVMAGAFGAKFAGDAASETHKAKSESPDKGTSKSLEDLAGEAYAFQKLYRGLRLSFITAPLFFVLWGASFAVPDKDTFYMIAASEAGQKALQTPEFGKIRTVVNQYLDGVIKKTEPEKKEDK